MRDPLTWSFPVGRFFGIVVRVHLLFIVFALWQLSQGLRVDAVGDTLWLVGLVFLSVLLHEFGHCFAARSVDGDATEILMWPLGGLAYCDAPNTPRAQFITVAGGPAVNLILCVAAAGALAVYQLLPPLSPFWSPFTDFELRSLEMATWAGGALHTQLVMDAVPIFFARLFWLNWILFWFNTLLIGFPMDGGRILQCALWPRLGFTRATMAAIYAGWIVAIILIIFAGATIHSESAFRSLMLFALALFIFSSCNQQRFLLEHGGLSEDAALGYDFSQGYTSLEKDAPRPRRRRKNFLQRWLGRRAAIRHRQEEERRQAEERRVDELLAKVQNEGMQSLSEEERRFLNRVSAKYRDRNRS